MNTFLATRVAAILGFLAVGLGAFGAHSLKPMLIQNHMLEVWEKAVFYQFIHTVMLYYLGRRTPVPSGPWLFFFAGIVLFSGSLYVLALSGVRWLGFITPFGGVSFLIGWFCLAIRGDKD